MDEWMIYLIVAGAGAVISALMIKNVNWVSLAGKKAQKALDYLNEHKDSVPESLKEPVNAAIITLSDFIKSIGDNKLTYAEAMILIDDALKMYKAVKKLIG